MHFKSYLVIFLLIIPAISVFASDDDTTKVKTDYGANTQFFENLDSLTKLYYISQSLKLQQIDPSKCDSGPNPYFSDSVIKMRLESIVSIIDLPFNEPVRAFIDAYTSKKRGFMQVMIGLTDYYFPMFEEVLELYGLPQELKYLAIVESALNPRAVSKAGATGIWQFMYTTGKIYGLEVNSYVDDRRDPLKATYAAAEFLTELYALYGNWELAMAAYNCGPGNVNKAIRRSNGKTNFWEIYNYLPKETRGYVPLFIAATYLMNYYPEHNLVPVKVDLPLITDTIMIEKQVSIQLIADFMELPAELLQDLNPQYKTDIIPAIGRSYPLRLPASYATKFLDLQDSIYNWVDSAENKVAASVPDTPVSPVVKTVEPAPYKAPENNVALYYTVKTGDNLGYIATWYNVSISSIRSWNNLKGNLIKPGQKLVIYVPAAKAAKYKNVNDMTFEQKQGTSPETQNNGNSSNGYIIYIVKQGDSPWSIAQKYPGVSEKDIIRLNNITNSKGLKPGDKLKIPKK